MTEDQYTNPAPSVGAHDLTPDDAGAGSIEMESPGGGTGSKLLDGHSTAKKDPITPTLLMEEAERVERARTPSLD